MAGGVYRDLISESCAFVETYLPCIEHLLTEADPLGLGSEGPALAPAWIGSDVLVSALLLAASGEIMFEGKSIAVYVSTCSRETYLDYWRDYGDNPGTLRRYGETVAADDVGVLCLYENADVRAYGIFLFSDAKNSLITSAAEAYARAPDAEVDDTGGGGGARAEVYMRMAAVVAVAHSLFYALAVIAVDGSKGNDVTGGSALRPAQYAREWRGAEVAQQLGASFALTGDVEGYSVALGRALQEAGLTYGWAKADLLASYFRLTAYAQIYDCPLLGRKLANYWLHLLVASEWWAGSGSFDPTSYVNRSDATELRVWVLLNSQELGRKMACKDDLDARGSGVSTRRSSYPMSDRTWLGWKAWDPALIDEPTY